jgi:outer membrane lipoprotein-sorting protein
LSIALVLVILALLAAPAAAATPAAADPWALLVEVRRELAEAGPLQADFVQTYVPAGFQTGESESGQLHLALPDCLRWDYREPYAKSFLLCGGVVHAWNAEDKAGRRYAVDRRNEPGMDLLLLSVDDLRRRYRASRRDGPDGAVEIALAPLGEAPELRDALLVVDRAARRLREVSYRDREGNQTRFAISAYRSLAHRDLFTPPDGIEWRSDE